LIGAPTNVQEGSKAAGQMVLLVVTPRVIINTAE
jgi:hypothetical protein